MQNDRLSGTRSPIQPARVRVMRELRIEPGLGSDGHLPGTANRTNEPFRKPTALPSSTNANDTATPRSAVRPRHAWYLPVKVAVEWAGALVLLTVLSPVILLLAGLVKCTSDGPAFYAQSRLGYRGRVYRIYKLRTMANDAEKGTGPVWATKNDCRITPLGRLLRATHVDELPQLWNVLRGEMSLIGPRPERPEIAARIGEDLPEFPLRLRLRPGITGLAQMLLPADDPADANYRGVRAKLAHDLLYVRDTNPLMDTRIALSTTCYFVGAAIDAVRQYLVYSCGAAVRGCPINLDDACADAALQFASDRS